jgi:hypothetical protein
MKILTFDTENTGALRNKANPFDPRNECVLLSYRDPDVGTTSIDPIDIDEFRQKVDTTDWIIGFNLKYDMHWGRRYGVSFKGKEALGRSASAFHLDRTEECVSKSK